MLYTWDFKMLTNSVPQDGSGKVTRIQKKLKQGFSAYSSDPSKWEDPPSQHEMAGLFITEEVTEEVKKSYAEEHFWVIEHRLNSYGLKWVNSVIADLERRFPVDSRADGAGFWRYEAGPGVMITYEEAGYDFVGEEWAKLFGVLSPRPQHPFRMPDSYRPWTSSNSATPTCFLDTRRPAWTDSMGAPMVGGVAQGYVDMLYVMTKPQPSLIKALRKELEKQLENQLGDPTLVDTLLSSFQVVQPPGVRS